ncbi:MULTISPECIES: hypothetical protein [Lactococcus]|uniref:Uncharacterized protein n=1 Tax=Lactococcus hircilactis TaxID=1494462 RepID=A0A7X1Z9J3_9LACT|nr:MULTISPECIES: hypothetical protein [Lactococcus]MCT0441937.1 hypothetical protein [Lactococcus lactis subsp. lactis]MCT0504923.1 hypothetical protein [Lactococcus cremoris]MDG4964931.1 hypothetical protein [Lactococcus lactis]MDN5474372.1 hypothetical protein [Lactococcus lactis]MDR9868056.1 hypothetical protein [Lactococcus cremoris]
MKSEKWQGISGTLIHDETKGIIIDKNEKSDSLDYFSEKLKTDGKPLKEVREKMIKDSIKRDLKTNPLHLKAWFDKKYDNDNSEKSKEINSDKPTLQYKQIKSDISFFGESFLEGFLGFYGFELDNAVSRYESNLQIIETKELGIDDEAKYFLGTSQKGEFKKATSELPSKSIAEEELQKFFSKEKKQVQTQSIELTKDTDE